MNLKDLRTAIFAQTDWAPTQSVEAVERLNGFINRAYNDVCLEAPFLFFESQVKFATQVDVTSASDNDTISLTVVDNTEAMQPNAVNPWVFAQDGIAGSPGFTVWEIDRSWDGRMLEIDVPDPADNNKIKTFRNRIRAVYRRRVGQEDEYQFRLTVVTPWPYQTMGSGPFKYRIYSDRYYLPDDLIQVRSMRLWHEDRNWPLNIMGQEEAEDYSFADSPRVVSHGLPRTVFRREHFQLPGPSVAAEAVKSDPESWGWIGPEPPGEFEYVLTYCWGKRDMQFRNPTMGYHLGYADSWKNDQSQSFNPDFGAPINSSQNRFREPLWESSPSPVSDKITAPPPTGQGQNWFAGNAVQLTLPNIEYMQGFMEMGSQSFDTGAGPFTEMFLRENMLESGWHVRIYRRRISADFKDYSSLKFVAPSGVGTQDGGASIAGLNKLDLPTAFFLLAEFRIDGKNGGIFIDNGRIIPDYHRRLRDIHGYQSVKLYPYPDERYEVDIRCVRRPPKLVDNEDAPLVHAEAVDLIIHRTLMFLYENMGNPSMAQLAKGRYDENLFTLTKRYGDLRPPAVPVLRRFARARTYYGQRGQLKRWWTVKS